MSQQKLDVNTAALSIVMMVMGSLQRIAERRLHLPGMAVLYGFSGYGKSTAAAFVANRLQAYYVECKSVWTKKALLENILKIMGIIPAQTVDKMLDQVCEQLAKSGRPLIIDEFDYLVEKAAVSVVKDIYEGSKAPILLIGEERLPAKLSRSEHFHSRISEQLPAPAADAQDARMLAEFYCPNVTIEDDLINLIHTKAKGSVRRMVVNLERVKDEAASQGLHCIGLKQWGQRELYTGEAPQPRRAL